MIPSKKAKVKRQKLVLLFYLLPFTFYLLNFACSNNNSGRREYVIADSKAYEASIFRQNCAICHGQEANGKEMDGKLIPSLRYGEAEKLSEEQIYQQISNGKLPMPSFRNQLSEKELWLMVKFIKKDLQGKD